VIEAEWVQMQHRDQGFGEGRGKYSGRCGKVSQSEFLLKNIWIALLWMHFSPVKQGPRTIDKRAFRFDGFQLMIWEATRTLTGMVKGITVLRQPG